MAQKTVRLPRAERQRQILTIAAAAFAERGFGGITMEEIAGRVGVTRLILYRAFASKEDLYRAILNDTAVRLTSAMTEAVSDPAAPGGAALRAYLDAARRNPPAFMLLFTGAAASPLGIEIERARRRVRDEIARQALAQAAKEGITPDSFWSPLVAELTLAIVERGTQWWLDSAPSPAADDAFVEYLQRGVGGILGGIAAGHFHLRFPGGRARI
ncbi:MAG: TetR/AcrR family transcriptional regulator [Thermomicrobia bacterium]|nr:TetR/AcrR family transcriptional regulator [Thermomicrobia bacterium]MCA1723484.1 TetR/AcrR family transcriptional regulator [Thermomicrobia bacterium]